MIAGSQNQEEILSRVMNSAFDKAAVSFSKLVNTPVRIKTSQLVFVNGKGDLSCLLEEVGDLNILITQIIGDISGKSFLIFSREETEEIFKANKNRSTELNEAFLLEIDNIISASVISEMSNATRLRIYGDVPSLIKLNARHLQEFLSYETWCGETSSVIVCNAIFQFGNHEIVHPQFVWKLDQKIFEKIQALSNHAS